jgi:hypothetical protein
MHVRKYLAMCFKQQLFNIKAAAITPGNSLSPKAKNSKIVIFPNKGFALTRVAATAQLPICEGQEAIETRRV